MIGRIFVYLSSAESDFIFLIACAAVSLVIGIEYALYGFSGAAGYAAAKIDWRQRWRIIRFNKKPWAMQLQDGILSVNDVRRRLRLVSK